MPALHSFSDGGDNQRSKLYGPDVILKYIPVRRAQTSNLYTPIILLFKELSSPNDNIDNLALFLQFLKVVRFGVVNRFSTQPPPTPSLVRRGVLFFRSLSPWQGGGIKGGGRNLTFSSDRSIIEKYSAKWE